MSDGSGRKTSIESTYRLNIPGQILDSLTGNKWHSFLMSTDELLGLYQAIKETLNLT